MAVRLPDAAELDELVRRSLAMAVLDAPTCVTCYEGSFRTLLQRLDRFASEYPFAWPTWFGLIWTPADPHAALLADLLVVTISSVARCPVLPESLNHRFACIATTDIAQRNTAHLDLVPEDPEFRQIFAHLSETDGVHDSTLDSLRFLISKKLYIGDDSLAVATDDNPMALSA